jgi:hypothetical protein
LGKANHNRIAVAFSLGVACLAFWLGTNAQAESNGERCYTAVYDQQADGVHAHYARGEWDADRSLCVRAKNFTRTFLGKVGGKKAAQDNPDVHVMYVIDREAGRIYAPCGITVEPSGVLPPGTYDLSLNRIDTAVPDLGGGANCEITG